MATFNTPNSETAHVLPGVPTQIRIRHGWTFSNNIFPVVINFIIVLLIFLASPIKHFLFSHWSPPLSSRTEGDLVYWIRKWVVAGTHKDLLKSSSLFAGLYYYYFCNYQYYYYSPIFIRMLPLCFYRCYRLTNLRLCSCSPPAVHTWYLLRKTHLDKVER